MDPLSIAASIVALMGATEGIAVGINKLASLKNAPASVLALNNELSDLRLVLAEIQPLLEKHYTAIAGNGTPGPGFSGDSTILLSIQRAKIRLVELEVIVRNRLMVRMGVVDKLSWAFEQEKILRAKDDLRTARLNITAALGVVASSSSFRLEAQLQDFQEASEQGQAAISHALVRQGDMFEKAILSIIETQQQQMERLETVERSISCDSHQPVIDGHFKKQIGSSTTDLVSKTGLDTTRRFSDSPGSLFHDANFSALRMRFLRRQKCDPWCTCACHKQSRAETPQFLQSIVGALFVGYTGLPLLTPPCNSKKCHRTGEGFLLVNYYFPQWFLARIISVAVRYNETNIRKPEISMRVLNSQSRSEGIFQSSIRGDANAVKHFLTSGKASILDVTDDSGHTPLHLAVGNSKVEVIEVLLGMGSEPYLENRTQETPYEMAWTTIFSFQGTPNHAAWRVDEIRTLFPCLEPMEERRKLTRIHKVVLGVLHLSLEKELCRDRTSIDQGDADGKTALSWAAARGDSKAVETLLRHGASVDIPDRIGQGPLRQSIKAHDATCTKLLLDYGARVDQTDNWRQTALQSTLYYTNPVQFLKPLLKANASVNTHDNMGHSPLMEAVMLNHADAVQVLLAHGAEADGPNHRGLTPLHQGIQCNGHAALRILLKEKLDHTIYDQDRRTPLHWAADCADAETLKILKEARLYGLSAHDKDSSSMTAIDVAEKRRDIEEAEGRPAVNSAWIIAFADLLQSLVGLDTPRTPKTPKSPFGGSDVSDDFFVDAVQHLSFQQLADLAEEGHAP